jgi:ABC-type Zn2+ transport system substrate-binding protein/surface adhesin
LVGKGVQHRIGAYITQLCIEGIETTVLNKFADLPKHPTGNIESLKSWIDEQTLPLLSNAFEVYRSTLCRYQRQFGSIRHGSFRVRALRKPGTHHLSSTESLCPNF